MDIIKRFFRREVLRLEAAGTSLEVTVSSRSSTEAEFYALLAWSTVVIDDLNRSTIPTKLANKL
jgi:hypothetical protein